MKLRCRELLTLLTSSPIPFTGLHLVKLKDIPQGAMSGLEPLAALSLACNVLQLVEVGRQTIDLIKTVYRGGTPDDSLDRNAAVLGSISHEVKTCKRPANCPKYEQQLLVAAERCSTAARDLREEIQFLVGNAKQGCLASTLRVVAKTNWRRRRLERLKENLDSTEKLMQTGLLTRIWWVHSQNYAIIIALLIQSRSVNVSARLDFLQLMKSREKSRSSTSTAELELKELKGDLRSFIEQFQKGHRKTKELVLQEGLEIRKHVSSVSTKTIDSLGKVHQSLDSLVFQASQARRDRLLQSLKFPGLNERRNQVGEAYKDTGRWIFAGDGDEVDGIDDPAKSKEPKETRYTGHDDISRIKWDSFSNWLRSTDIFYWISGKPGSGKTTLVKNILTDPNTQFFLNIWHPEPLIISHFFWRPGTQLQQNIKGLLCSLLHQLLQNSTTALDSVLSSVPHSDTKDADTDWSAAELLELCLRVLYTYDCPVCIFLDGLDEVDPQDGVAQLLNLVDKLAQIQNTKICLSSRPEPLLQKRLSIYPRLRLQDLNMGDLELYARDHVKLPDGYIMEQDGSEVIYSLVDKAEGVFLWLVLAINSINRGAEYGDTTAIFQERIRHLPGDLISLYQDMWQRTCEDDPLVYRQTAALYFRLLLIHRKRRSLFEHFAGFDLFSFVLASTSTADEILQGANEAPKVIPEDVILHRCEEVERKVDVYCFGLIEIGPGSSLRNAGIGLYGDSYDRLLPFTNGNKVLKFIHRTAYDFLVDTVDGKEILKFDMSSEMSLEMRITKAYLSGSQLFLHGDYCGFTTCASFAAMPLCCMKSLRLTYQHTDDWMPADWRQLLHHCEILCNAGKLFVGFNYQARLCKSEDFLKVVANICGDERILLAIKDGKLSKDTKSDILLNACNTYANGYRTLVLRDSSVEESVRMLLREGADPNYEGVMFSPDLWYWPFALLQTPFTEYLRSTLIHPSHRYLSPKNLFAVLETICIYIYHKANLDEMITIFFKFSSQSDRKNSFQMAEPFPMIRLTWVDSSRIFKDEKNIILLASFPAHIIIDTLFHIFNTMRQEYPLSTEETGARELLLFLEDECKNWCSREYSRLLGKICHGEGLSEVPAWFETTGEQQKRIASELLSQLRNWQPILSYSGKRVEITDDDESLEKFLSLCTQAPWVQKMSGEDAIWERLEELGVFTRIDETCELRSTEDWAKEQRSRYFAGNN